MGDNLKHISKFMSLVLRHNPTTIGLRLDESGWADVHELLHKMNAKGLELNTEILETIVEKNDKKRFAFNADHSKIRASQGHSLEVNLDIPAAVPPDILYHVTTERFLESILTEGLKKRSRQHVHLSATIDTATSVGARRGKPIILLINAKAMFHAGWVFYLSENKVWLTDAVPPQYISS